MFLKNKYTKLYFKIIKKRKKDKIEGYVEKHHVIPKSIGGTDYKKNIVSLTAREHFICHYLLTKMIPKNSSNYKKLLKAFIMMKSSSNNQYRYFNNRLYETAKLEFRKIQSESQKGKLNTQYGTVWITKNGINKKIKNEELEDYLIKGWIKGRVLKPKKCKFCKKEFFEKGSFCSNECKTYFRSPHFKLIDDNYEKIKEWYQEYKSINKVLSIIFNDYKENDRRGNKYLSEKLREDGFEIKKRGIRK